jgi:hypothetical protein
MAHKGEAQEFIRRKHTLNVGFYFNGMYRDDQELLLLTSDRTDTVMRRITEVFEYYGKKIRGVLNLGIAGALDRKLQINQIYSVKKVFSETESEVFHTANRRGQVDCISVVDPVLNDESAKKISGRSQIVDQELWTCARVCREYNIPLKSYKLISDYAGSNTRPEKIKWNSQSYSRHLFDFYKKLPS